MLPLVRWQGASYIPATSMAQTAHRTRTGVTFTTPDATAALRQQRHRAERSAATAPDLHREAEERRAPNGQRVEAGQILEDRDVRVRERAVRPEVVRRPVVDGGRVDADRAEPPRRREPRGRVAVDAGEMEVCRVAGHRATEVASAVVPPAIPPGPHDDDGTVGDPTGARLERLDRTAGEQGIRIARGGGAQVDHDRRTDEPVERDLVGRPAACREMDR